MGELALAGLVDRVAGDARVVGVSAALVVGDKTVAAAASGTADLDAGVAMSVGGACNWFSMTKIATATAAMMLVERGELDLDAPVVEYLAEVWPSRFRQVRVRHLLSHSSGLGNPLPIRWVHAAGKRRPDPRSWLARLLAKQRRLRFEPGLRAAYSNVGYLAVGEVISATARCPFENFVSAELLRPLNMDHTAFSWNDLPADTAAVTGHQQLCRVLTPVLRRFLPDDLLNQRAGRFVQLRAFELDGAAYGGLIGPVTDAARLIALHCNGGTVDGLTLLSPSTVNEMATITTRGRPYDLGLGWFRPSADRGRRVEHFGGGMGFWNLLRVDPSSGSGIAIMSNVTHHWNITQLADAALDHAIRD